MRILKYLSDLFSKKPTAPETKKIEIIPKEVVQQSVTVGPYTDLYNKMSIRPEWMDKANYYAERILKNKDRYQRVADKMSKPVPWFFIAGIHLMESDLSFNYHLANGDPLSARTVHVPKGIPTKGQPPFTWEEAALAALEYDKIQGPLNGIESLFGAWEKFNGLGSRKHGINTPYLWSGTNLYSKGKYVSDGVWDANAVSKQIGIVPVMKILKDKGAINLA